MESMGFFFSFKYKLSLNLIDLIIPFVIQYDFLCLCLSNLTVFTGMCLFIALVKVSRRMSYLSSILAFVSALIISSRCELIISDLKFCRFTSLIFLSRIYGGGKTRLIFP